MRKILKQFLAIAFLLCVALQGSAQVEIIILSGTNILDYRVLNTNFAALNTGLFYKVSRSGDIMSGNLKTPDPTATNDVTTKSYVDGTIDSISTLWFRSTSNNVPAGRYEMTEDVPTNGAELTITAPTAGQYIVTWQAPTNYLNSILEGAARVQVLIRKDGQPGTTSIKPEMYVYHADTTEPEWAELGQPFELDKEFLYPVLTLPVTFTNLPAGASAVLKIKVIENTANQDIIIGLGINGFGHIRVPVPISGVFQDSWLMSSGAVWTAITSFPASSWPAVSGAVTAAANSWPAVSGAVTAAAGSWPAVSGAVTEAAQSWPAVSGAVVLASTPIGGIIQYGNSNAPSGWLMCDGGGSHTNIYAALHAVIGYQFGGSGTNFLRPDLRRRMAAGMGSGYTLGATGGYENVTLTELQLAAHTHTATGAGALSYACPVPPAVSGTDTTLGLGNNANKNSGSAGAGHSHSNMPPYIVLNSIIFAGK